MIANTPATPYYAVIFSTLTTENLKGYEETANRMEELAKVQKGYLGIESARNKLGITVSYWDSLEAIENWKNNLEHIEAREKGRALWYKKYHLRICKVERDYGFEK
ncbi:antibiotic biosynthesis monooxygenase family protein [Urechidicola croceus]|uniref:Antibiotic biosynthesis monooxygenase n=1 Tax=Urechidicola croceus TaxID=1850246 RepID=A0A1D8P5Z1_9FLAO|nr:antibiotic biosynthesis monooxygenase [Urechidicola croceus]AOW19985.1 antibiotic biosynthesis monooxygenase [Urechidicola croceus]